MDDELANARCIPIAQIKKHAHCNNTYGLSSENRDDKLQRNKTERNPEMHDKRSAGKSRDTNGRMFAEGAQSIQRAQQGYASALENVRDLNVKLIDIARSNTEAAFDFAREVAGAEAPSDLVEVWTTQATKQFRALTQQASELAGLGQRLARESVEPVARAAEGSD